MRLKKEMLEAKRRREEELRGKQIEAEDSELCVDCLCQLNTSCHHPTNNSPHDDLVMVQCVAAVVYGVGMTVKW